MLKPSSNASSSCSGSVAVSSSLPKEKVPSKAEIFFTWTWWNPTSSGTYMNIYEHISSSLVESRTWMTSGSFLAIPMVLIDNWECQFKPFFRDVFVVSSKDMERYTSQPCRKTPPKPLKIILSTVFWGIQVSNNQRLGPWMDPSAPTSPRAPPPTRCCRPTGHGSPCRPPETSRTWSSSWLPVPGAVSKLLSVSKRFHCLSLRLCVVRAKVSPNCQGTTKVSPLAISVPSSCKYLTTLPLTSERSSEGS